MAGPWEKYQQRGPWEKYQATAPAPAAQQASQTIPNMLSGMDKPAPPPVNQGLDAPTYVGQQANRAIADVLGAPFDLSTLAVNGALAGVDRLGEAAGWATGIPELGGLDYRFPAPALGGDSLANAASSVYEAAGGHVVPPEAVSKGVRNTGALARGAAAAALPATALASAPMQAAGQGSRILGALTSPYQSQVGGTIARDAVAGAGSAMGAQAYDDYAPEAVQDSSAGPLLKMIASIIGGVGGASTVGTAEGLAMGGGKGLKHVFSGADENAPINKATGAPFAPGEMDLAAQVAQQIPSSKMRTLDQIDQGLDYDGFGFAPPSARPTTGMMSDDIGMAMHENTARSIDGQRFIEQDTRRRALAGNLIDETVPQNSNPRQFTDEAKRQFDETLGGAEKGVEDAASRQDQHVQSVQGQQALLDEMRARQPQASTALAGDVNTRLDGLMNRKNENYRAVPDDTVIPGQPVKEALDAVHETMPEMGQGGAYGAHRGALNQRLQGDAVLDAEGNPTGATETRDLTYGDLRAARAGISKDRMGEVVGGGNPEFLDRVGGIVARELDQANPEAARYHRETFVPQAKTGEMGEYYNARKRAAATGEESSGTRPSEVAGRFLKTPEGASRLPALRGVDDKDFPQGDATNWMLGEMAKAGVVGTDGALRFNKFKQWADNNKGVIDQFPEMRKRIDAELATAQQGGVLSKQLADDVARAKTNLKTTQAELDQSALKLAIGKAPEKAVGAVLGGPDPEKHMAEMVGRLKGNVEATNGLKAATRDWIKQKATNSGALLGQDGDAILSQSKLTTLFKQHEATLAKVYDKDEMNALRQAHKLMKVETSRDIRAATGSNTAEKKVSMAQNTATEQRKRVLEAGLKLKYGVLMGGGINRTVNLFLSALPNKDKALSDILYEMHFNPELAKHLLTRPVKEVGSQAWNAKLNRLLAVATGARESNENQEK